MRRLSPAEPADSAASDSAASDPALSDPTLSDSTLSDPALSDSALSDSALSDSAGLRRVVETAGPDLLAYFERRVTVREDAADLLAETLLQAWRRVRDLPAEPERRRMWLFTTAAHVLTNHRRTVRRRTALAGRLRAHLATAGSPPEVADGGAVRDAVRRLPDAQRELVMLVHWDGFSLTEAATLLGLNPSTARSRYAAARAGLRRALGEIPSGR